MGEHRLIFDTPVSRIEVGGGVALLFFEHVGLDPNTIGVEHVCRRWPDDQEPGGDDLDELAVRLNPAHVVTQQGRGPEPIRYTVRASIACPDCGLHGYVTDSKWEAA